MAKIILQGMHFRAFIGVHDFEQAEGNDIVVDLEIADPGIQAKVDNLHQTIDYAIAYRAVEEVMQNRYQLLETAAADILHNVRRSGLHDAICTVRIAKLRPPLGGDVDRVIIEMSNTEL